MRISRRGASRYRGTKTIAEIDFAAKNYRDWASWNKNSKSVEITGQYVPLGDGRTSHNYKVELSLQDITSLIAILAHAGSATDAELLRKHLKDQIPSLVKLLACATGLVPTPMQDPPAK